MSRKDRSCIYARVCVCVCVCIYIYIYVCVYIYIYVFCCECCVLSGRGVCDELITCPEESYGLWCVVVCDLESSRMRRPWPALGLSATAKKKIVYIYIYIYTHTHTHTHIYIYIYIYTVILRFLKFSRWVLIEYIFIIKMFPPFCCF
jgi:hypothetical protein